MILDIVKVDYTTGPCPSVLRQNCDPIVSFNRSIHDFSYNLVETMFAANGVGLAAPQVGVGQNVFVMRTTHGLQNDTRDVHIFINPKLMAYSEATYFDFEGCLSIPNLQGRVKRYKEVKFEYVDVQGNPQGATLKGLSARIFQHEYDHLSGVLFPDRAEQCFRPVRREELHLDSTDERSVSLA